MNRSFNSVISTSITAVLLMAVSLSCGGETKESVEPTPADFLLESFELSGHSRSSEVRTFVGQDLYELINGGAEIFHLYQFVDVANAYYNEGELELTADIFRFATADLAYGLFSTLRPMTPESAGLGVESNQSATSVSFVKGRFMVRVTGFEESEASGSSILKLAQTLELSIPGTSKLPDLFKLLPTVDAVANSNKIIAVDFLGRAGLNDIYTRDYIFDGEQLTIFIAEDESGGKFMSFRDQVETDPSLLDQISSLPYDTNLFVGTNTSYYGAIVLGLKDGKLCGMTGFNSVRHEFLDWWLRQLGNSFDLTS